MPSVITAFRDLDRLRDIVAVLWRHGFGEVVQRLGLDTPLVAHGAESADHRSHSIAQRVRFVLQDLGPSFVKLGQIASTRADLLPPEVITELKILQDDVKPITWEAVRGEIEGDLGGPVGELFLSVEERPLASASIAQVHRGRLPPLVEGDGPREVAIKVQRPGIQETVARDVDLLYWFARALERAVPESRRYSPVDLVAEFDRSIKAELDFLQEADHAERFAKNFEGDTKVRFPGVFRSHSGKRVLTLEFLDGRKLNDALAQGLDGRALASVSVHAVIKMIFEDGFFHADPHPGNLLVLGPNDAPVVGLLDLGLVGHLSGATRDRALDLMVAAAREDYSAVADALYALGRPTRKVDMAAFRTDVETLGRKYVGRALGEIEVAAVVRDLIWGAVKHGIDMPPDFMLVGRALMTLEGTARQIAPDLDVFSEAKPYLIRLVAQRYSPDKLTGDLMRTALRLSGMAGQMPEQVSEILEDLRKGHLTLKTADAETPQAFDRLGRRLFASLVVASLVLGGSAVLAVGRHPWVGAALLAAALIGGVAHVVTDWWRALGLRR
jgi:ubiquinone biosynthesis protein